MKHPVILPQEIDILLKDTFQPFQFWAFLMILGYNLNTYLKI